VAAYTASSAEGELVVSVGDSGESLKVSLSPAAVAVGDEELTTRILRLSTLVHLQRQCAERHRNPAGAQDHKFSPSEAQVAAYAATLDF
jgi:hypothetical protein